MRFEVILFDLGDTLIYFDDDWSSVFAQARQALLRSLQQAGLPLGQDFLDDFYCRLQEYYRERDSEFIEYTMQYLLRNTLLAWGLGETPPQVIEQALRDFYTITQAHWFPEEDALPTLATLHSMGYRLGLISNASDDDNTQTLVDKAGVRPYMEVIISSAAVGVRKPNPRIFNLALEKMGVKPEQAAMVGDTLGADILGAKNAGLFAIWITRRANTAANRAQAETIHPDACIATLAELPPLLSFLERRGAS